MKLGTFKKVSWRDFEVRNFQPNSAGMGSPYQTCGTALISMLTGERPKVLERKLPRGQKHWSNAALTRHLRNKGSRVQEITVGSVVGDSWQDFPITEDHIIILNLRVDRNDASWFLLHRNLIWHNFSGDTFNTLWLLNKPIQNCYAVTPPKKNLKRG